MGDRRVFSAEIQTPPRTSDGKPARLRVMVVADDLEDACRKLEAHVADKYVDGRVTHVGETRTEVLV